MCFNLLRNFRFHLSMYDRKYMIKFYFPNQESRFFLDF